jgi:hypothetical protein
MKRLLLCVLFAITSHAFAQHVVINEVMSSNTLTLRDENGDASDWIELYNPGPATVNLTGCGLSDDTTLTLKWRFGTASIAAGGHLIVFASDKDRRSGPYHANFKISASGEPIVLSDSTGTPIDRIFVPASATDISYGRIGDGNATWGFQRPSPGTANTTTAIGGWADSVAFSPRGGFFTSPQSVTLTAGTSVIYYTLDGRAPDTNATRYTTAIPIDSTRVLRVMTAKPGFLNTRPATQTFFINVSTNLPVVSLTASPYDLFDPDSGIYTNFTQDWERPAHIEFFEDDKSPGFSEDCGIEIHGTQSANWAQKSFAVKFKQNYGISVLQYPLFPGFRVTSFDSFVLRNSGNDWQYTHMRDALMQMLVRDLDIEYEEYRPATAFVNGRYWGIYNIREKISEHYVEHRHGVDPDNIDMLENNKEIVQGDSLHYKALIDFISANDMTTPAAFAYLDSVIDLTECVLYFAAQAYYDNMDWPGGNIRYWRERVPGSKWRWILMDLDFGFGLYAHGAFEDHIAFMFATTPTRYSNPPWATLLQRQLVENPTIRNRFINQVADLLNTNFRPSRVVTTINTMANHIATELVKHRARWGLAGESTAKLITFAQDRPGYLRTHMRSYFACGADGALSLNSTTGGAIRLNTLTLRPSDAPFNGVYFQGNPVQLRAVPDPGYRFAGWSGTVTSTADSMSLTPGASTTLTATFVQDLADTIGVVINEINYNSNAAFNPGDWIELYNGSTKPADLSGWHYTDSDPTHLYTFPAGTVLGAGEYLVVAEDTVLFRSCFPAVARMYGSTAFGLSGSGESMKLMDAAMGTVDSLAYLDKAPWPTEPDGGGATLELVSAGSNNMQGANWKASAGHGTPGQKNSVTTAVDPDNTADLPTTTGLEQSYPNPFNGITQITFRIAREEMVALKVFDMLGREVATLYEGRCLPGVFGASFNAASLASGVYLYRLQTPSHAETRKIILMK